MARGGDLKGGVKKGALKGPFRAPFFAPPLGDPPITIPAKSSAKTAQSGTRCLAPAGFLPASLAAASGGRPLESHRPSGRTWLREVVLPTTIIPLRGRAYPSPYPTPERLLPDQTGHAKEPFEYLSGKISVNLGLLEASCGLLGRCLGGLWAASWGPLGAVLGAS